jgi:plasmid maintenance system killer protein
MKIRYIILLFSIIAFAACNSETKKVEPLPEKVITHSFTDTVHLDTFKVVLKGKESKNMSLLFTINNYKGEEIYKVEIKAETLLKSYLASEDLKKENDKIKFLNDEVNFFFEEEHFLVPAITAEEKPDQNTPDKNFYEELKQNQLNGFSYSLGKDSQLYIAWSVKEQKVKVYYKCC